MAGRSFSFPGKLVYILICTVVVIVLAGCAPKIPPSMSPEDLQKCDELAVKMGKSSDVSKPSSNAKPYLVKPGQVEINSPSHGSVLPFTQSVVIKFKQPPADVGVLYRNYRVIVTPLSGSPDDYVGNPYAVVTQPPTDFQVTWTPPGYGKYFIMVLIRNLETIPQIAGNTNIMSEQLAKMPYMSEDFTIHYGPFSLAYVCVQIDLPKAGGAKTLPPAELMPLENITLPPTNTRTVTLIPSSTATLTLTPTFTATFTPTFTSTFTPYIPTFTSTFTPTNAPTAACSTYTDQTSCENHNKCKWVPGSTNPGVCKAK